MPQGACLNDVQKNEVLVCVQFTTVVYIHVVVLVRFCAMVWALLSCECFFTWWLAISPFVTHRNAYRVSALCEVPASKD